MNFINSRAVALLEVLIAFVVLAISAVTAGTMMYTATRTNTLSKNEFIATNLAREGIEAVRNIIETNWLRCSANKAESWLMIDTSATCSAGTMFAEGKMYAIDLDPTKAFKWRVNEASNQSDMMHDDYHLDIKTVSTTPVETKYYLHSSATYSPFYRNVKIDFKDSDSDGFPDDEKITVISTVQWKDRSRTAKVEETTTINNF